jgi:hypothetical protein
MEQVKKLFLFPILTTLLHRMAAFSRSMQYVNSHEPATQMFKMHTRAGFFIVNLMKRANRGENATKRFKHHKNVIIAFR